MKDIIEVVHRYLSRPDTAWSVAVFGAIAEFHANSGDTRTVALEELGGSIVDVGGAMRIAIAPETRLSPFEILTKRREYWLQGINFCLPAKASAIALRKGLTEIGPDGEALRAEGKGAVLFDLGLGFPSIETMVRTSDPSLVSSLRDQIGAAILEPEGHGVYELLIGANPHRVFRSRLGRVEVYNPIPRADGRTSPGPHTHILPDSLAAGRTHSANVSVPAGFVPVFQAYPPNPVLDRSGAADACPDAALLEEFADLSRRFGDPVLEAAKTRVRNGIDQGLPPPDPRHETRPVRTAMRVALRQVALRQPDNATVARWQTVFEAQDRGED